MIGSSGLSGDTLIACHFPVLPIPTWQLPVRNVYASNKRPGRLCSAGLTRAVSLPEQDTLKQESVVTSSQKHFSSSYSSLIEDRAEEEGASESSGRYDSTSSPEDESCRARANVRTHNSFLPTRELDEEDEDEDSDGDNLHRYHEDSSFVLHGNPNWPQACDEGQYLITHRDLSGEWGQEGTMLGFERHHVGTHCNRINKTPCGPHKYSPELFSNSLTEEVSECSSNSSDGILVNFCTIYNRSSNPAVPLDLCNPADLQSPDGSVFLNLHPVLHSGSQELHQDESRVYPSPNEESQQPSSSSYWSPQDFNSNCNLNFLDPLAPCLTSLEVSDLAACLQSQATMSMESQQKYYKLVTCDLSSQSPSPAWSSQASCPEGPSTNPFHTCTLKKAGQHTDPEKDEEKQHQQSEKVEGSPLIDFQVASTSTEKDTIQNTSIMPTYLDTRTSTSRQEHRDLGAGMNATPSNKSGSWCGKPQRPNSLPIQPIVLTPPTKPAAPAQHLGCLLDRYMSQKNSSQPSRKFKSKSGKCSSNSEPTPVDSQWSTFLEAPSSSDTCSTCSPSPDCLNRRNTLSDSRKEPQSPCNQSCLSATPALMRENSRASTGKTNPFLNMISPPNQILHVQIPTYKTLDPSPDQPRARIVNHPAIPYTPPTLPLTTETHQRIPSCPTRTSNPPNKPCAYHPAPDSSFSFSAALSSVVPLSSLGSLISLAASGLHRNQSDQNTESLIQSDKPPTEFCLSPETSYESMSISHLQRRGLLRSVSRAVDLIMAHFGSSRDFEEKMRLGNSFWSPTIGGLVLEHLCPAIQNILEDGMRDHKLDLIIGQRRNHCWNIVEVSTKMGPSTKVLYSLVYKIQQCPQLTSSCMRLRAFIMGLLNLRALEFWLSHLLSLRDVVTSHYHSWGFLSMSLGRCQPMFQELLLLLQPLSVLPFDLNLLLEPRLLHSQQLCSEALGVSSPPPCSALLATSWPQLQCDRKMKSDHCSGELLTSLRQDLKESRSQILSPIAEWWPQDVDVLEAVDEAEQWRKNNEDNWSQISMDSRQGGSREGTNSGTPNVSPSVQVENDDHGGLRWAKLFGATDTSARAHSVSQSQVKRCSRPSQWLSLDRSHLGLLAQSLKALAPGRDKTDLDDEC
ncbi:uncharacterized protein ACB057_000748 [Neosynchiropus ocellatus]